LKITINLVCALIFFINISAHSAAETYTVGVVPQFDIRQIERIWQPILKEVSARSGVTLKLNASTSIPAFEKEFESGEFHFAYMNPYHAIVANQQQGYTPILRDLGKRLFGIIVVHKDSPITEIKQIDGKKVAMPAPNALGASLLPRAEFATKFNIKPKISYVRSHDSVFLNTAMGISDAGGAVMATFNRQPKEVRNQLRILYKTGDVPKHPITVHPSVPADVAKRVTAAFLELGNSSKGKALLSKIPMKKIGSTKLKDYQMLIDMGLKDFYVKKK